MLLCVELASGRVSAYAHDEFSAAPPIQTPDGLCYRTNERIHERHHFFNRHTTLKSLVRPTADGLVFHDAVALDPNVVFASARTPASGAASETDFHLGQLH